ncbi:MAG: hypothetical protein R3F14_44945 [Polyangiaceae bacterium]
MAYSEHLRQVLGRDVQAVVLAQDALLVEPLDRPPARLLLDLREARAGLLD